VVRSPVYCALPCTQCQALQQRSTLSARMLLPNTLLSGVGAAGLEACPWALVFGAAAGPGLGAAGLLSGPKGKLSSSYECRKDSCARNAAS